MHSKSRSSSSFIVSTPYVQRGDALLEALISVLLMSIVGLGLIYTTSRVEVSHRQSTAAGLAIGQMRSLLQRFGTTLCASEADADKAVIYLPPNDTKFDLAVTCSTPTVYIQDTLVTTTPKSIYLTTPTTADRYFGGTLKVGE